ncbi:MAG TPA: hypothetical protein PLN21_16500 [Gemmatales bacterium]|nr:hypothetical protein [Gemmatales bacterium]
MFQIHCPLGHTLEIGKEHIGQRLMCPLCNAVVHTSPPRPGEPPGAKYEVQCAQGHILRVKRKYLGKEIRCPSCQQLVSMKPGMMLTSNGMTLSVAKPDAFKKQTKAKQEPPPPKQQLTPTIRIKSVPPTKRIPPPPNAGQENDTDDQKPMAPELVENDSFLVDDAAIAPKATTVGAVTVPDDDFEFEVVDTQFNMELKESGIDPIHSKPSKKKVTLKAPPAPSVQAPPAAKNAAPTGLHSLSGSEMMQVNNAARESREPLSMTQFNCPNGHLLEVESKYQGMQVQCPMCKVIFEMSAA